MRLSQPESESVLWPWIILCSTEVAAHSQSNIWKQDSHRHQLRWRLAKSDEEGVPPGINDLQWDPFFPSRGLPSSFYIKRNILSYQQDDPEYNAYERDIALVNLFFPDSTVFGQSFKVKWWFHFKQDRWWNILSETWCQYIKRSIVCRVWEIPKDDLVWLHLQLWRFLWPLPWNQFCLCRRNPLLVLNQTLQELCNLNKNLFVLIGLNNWS